MRVVTPDQKQDPDDQTNHSNCFMHRRISIRSKLCGNQSKNLFVIVAADVRRRILSPLIRASSRRLPESTPCCGLSLPFESCSVIEWPHESTTHGRNP